MWICLAALPMISHKQLIIFISCSGCLLGTRCGPAPHLRALLGQLHHDQQGMPLRLPTLHFRTGCGAMHEPDVLLSCPVASIGWVATWGLSFSNARAGYGTSPACLYTHPIRTDHLAARRSHWLDCTIFTGSHLRGAGDDHGGDDHDDDHGEVRNKMRHRVCCTARSLWAEPFGRPQHVLGGARNPSLPKPSGDLQRTSWVIVGRRGSLHFPSATSCDPNP
jgi:hypothetical protein